MIDVCIIFPGGSYGTFVEWCLNYFSNPNFDQTLPFTATGSSHNFGGYHLRNCELLPGFVDKGQHYNIGRIHPKIKKDDNIFKNCEFIKSVSNKIIYIYPNLDSFIWTINNKFEKIYDEGYLIDSEEIIAHNLSQWDGGKLENMQPWEIREFLSFFIYKQHLSEVELENLDLIKQQFSDFYFMDVKELRDNFRSIIENLLGHCNLPMIRHSEVENIYNKWLAVQYHSNKDSLVAEITDAVVEDRELSWADKNLTLIDEAFIQMNLRNHNIEIQCFNLNQFPTSTKELKPLLYAA